jgi:hypothetical protein
MVVGAAGCSPWSTYPPVETSMAQRMSKPTFEPVPTVMTVAVQYAKDHFMQGHDFAINLPEGTPADVYEKVFHKLGFGRPMVMPNEAALHIQEVRTRGFNAQVDVIYPRTDGLNQMATLTMSRGALDKYKVTDVRIWQSRNLQLPAPHYVAPPPEPVKERTSK